MTTARDIMTGDATCAKVGDKLNVVERQVEADLRRFKAFIEGRIRDLEYQLANAEVIDDHPAADYVRIGSRVTVLDTSGEEEVYTIVGTAEADPRRGFISNESPVGRALLGKRPGEKADVVAPGGSFALTIVRLA